MHTYLNSKFFRQSMLALIAVPLLILAAGNFPERSVLKESLSIIAILAFCQMMGQFFWARASRFVMTDIKMSNVLKYHKIIGYIFVAILIFHPLYIVLPRFFEAGISPSDAFVTLITTMKTGIVLGIIAWCLMLILGVTAFIRERLPMKYKTWRVVHGLLAIVFIVAAAWHVIDLGRHSNRVMCMFISLLTAGGVLLLLRSYTTKKTKKTTEA